MDEVRIGFIGCGGNARGHMQRLGEVEGARVVAVCDLVEDAAREAAQLTGGAAYTDFRRMLERDDLDAAYLSIPVFAHGEPELAVIARGLPFLVEKPVARHLETALEIEGAVRKAGLITCVGYQLRYSGAVDLARQALVGQAISLVVGKYWSGSGRGDPDRWVRQLDKSGGQLLEQATHTIDMMRYLAGEVVEVSARHASRQLSHLDCPDVHCVTFEFESGALGSLTTVWAYDPLDWSHTNVVEVLYGQCLLQLSRDTVVVKERQEVVEEGQTREAMATREQTAAGPSIDAIFVDAVRRQDRSRIRSDYGEGVKNLAVCLAALEAGEHCQPVRPADLIS